MYRARVIPCLLLQGGGLVKTKLFRNPVYVGDPINAIKIFNEKEVDELVLLDISATSDGRGPNFELIAEVAGECFMPLAYGGGVQSIEQIKKLLSLGVEKVVINSAVHYAPEFIKAATKVFGGQALIASIDVKKRFFHGHEVVVWNGKRYTGIDPVKFSRYAESLGVGEILLTSIDRDGTMSGYDIELVKQVSSAVNIPVIASGGAGSVADLQKVVSLGMASAAAAGSLFVFFGQHKAVLISYPSFTELSSLFSER